jgi:diacylglycerol kinase (ATP)
MNGSPPPASPDSPFDRIVIIFNPNSTGDAPELAEELKAELAERLPRVPIELKPTEYAGHARELAKEAADSGAPLIVSVSGDGGYNEVVNGVMHSPGTRAVCAVKAAGNANDHRRVTREQPLADAIVEGKPRRIDLLRITIGDGPEARTSYAHSYIGFGLTPVVAIDLEKGGKGSFREMISVVRTFAKFQPFEIALDDGTRRRIDSLVLANIPEMAKVAKLSEAAEQPNDGRFEVILFPHASKAHMLIKALKAATKGLGPQQSVHEFSFTSVKPMPFQLDGEVEEIDARTPIRVESATRALAIVG